MTGKIFSILVTSIFCCSGKLLWSQKLLHNGNLRNNRKQIKNSFQCYKAPLVLWMNATEIFHLLL